MLLEMTMGIVVTVIILLIMLCAYVLSMIKQYARSGDYVVTVDVSTSITGELSRYERLSTPLSIDKALFIENVGRMLSRDAYPLVHDKEVIAYVSKCLGVAGRRAKFRLLLNDVGDSRKTVSAFSKGKLRLKITPRMSYTDKGRSVTGVRSFYLTTPQVSHG